MKHIIDNILKVSKNGTKLRCYLNGTFIDVDTLKDKEFYHFIIYNYEHITKSETNIEFGLRYAINYLKNLSILLLKRLSENSEITEELKDDISYLTIEHIVIVILRDKTSIKIDEIIDRDVIEEDFPEYFI
jgi:nicotinic acid phosphoribosyltransferase